MKVSRQQFEEGLTAYGREKLTCDTTAICDPPRTRYHDFRDGRVWPQGLVGYVVRNDLWDQPSPCEYFLEATVLWKPRPTWKLEGETRAERGRRYYR